MNLQAQKIFSVVLMLLTLNCSNSDSQSEGKISNKVNKELTQNFMKIVLISNIEGVPTDKVEETLREYFHKAFNKEYMKDELTNMENLIEGISVNVGLSKRQVSSLLFCYIYEMRTNEEVIEEYLDKLSKEEEQYYDSYEGRY